MVRRNLSLILLAAAVTQRVGAQGATVHVEGVVYDSLRGAPMRDAHVTIIGTSRAATTDASGHFAFDGLAPGTYTFAAQNDAIDSLGFAGFSTRAIVREGVGEIRIAVPSFATLWHVACGPSKPPTDSGFVFGTVRDARTQDPIDDATVDVMWVEIRLDSAVGYVQRRWRGQTHSDSTGTYARCGVPLDVPLRVRATVDSGASGLIDLPVRDTRVRRRDLLIGPMDSASKVTGTIIGRLTNADGGGPAPNARVVMDEVPEVRSAADGRFTIRNVPAGTRQLEILAVGMTPMPLTVDVVAKDTVLVTAELRKVNTLDAVKVTASAHARAVIGDFEQRRRSGFGYVKDSSSINANGTLSSIFYDFPGVQLEHGYGHQISVSLKAMGMGRCTAVLWLDGVLQRDWEELDALHNDEIAAVEVYPRALSVPIQFQRSGSVCGAVVVWTKWEFSR